MPCCGGGRVGLSLSLSLSLSGLSLSLTSPNHFTVVPKSRPPRWLIIDRAPMRAETSILGVKLSAAATKQSSATKQEIAINPKKSGQVDRPPYFFCLFESTLSFKGLPKREAKLGPMNFTELQTIKAASSSVALCPRRDIMVSVFLPFCLVDLPRLVLTPVHCFMATGGHFEARGELFGVPFQVMWCVWLHRWVQWAWFG